MTVEPRDLVSEIRGFHLNEIVASMRSGLSFALRAIENDWLPSDNDEQHAVRRGELARYLEDKGQPEVDPFVLGVGMVAPGTYRGIEPPLKVLEDSRGGWSSSRFQEAQGQIENLGGALAVGRWAYPELPFDTREAIGRLRELSEGVTGADEEELRRLYRQLSPSEADRLASIAIQFLDSDLLKVRDAGSEMLRSLADLRPDPLSRSTLSQLAERRVFWPSSVYRDANDHIARMLVSVLEEPCDQLEVNHLLLALAWTRSGAAADAFRSWRSAPPEWAARLYVPPHEYLPSAGWCLTAQGDRRELISLSCFRLYPAEPSDPGSIPCHRPAGAVCPACGAPLTWLFDFSTVGSSFFRGALAAAPRRVLACLHCACFHGVSFSTYGGEMLPAPPGEHPQLFQEGDDWIPPECHRTLDSAAFPPFAAAEPFSLDDASTLGGIPMWLQDADFPTCPQCTETMFFLAQFDNGSMGEEGIFYSFFCSSCELSGVTYQQT